MHCSSSTVHPCALRGCPALTGSSETTIGLRSPTRVWRSAARENSRTMQGSQYYQGQAYYGQQQQQPTPSSSTSLAHQQQSHGDMGSMYQQMGHAHQHQQHSQPQYQQQQQHSLQTRGEPAPLLISPLRATRDNGSPRPSGALADSTAGPSRQSASHRRDHSMSAGSGGATGQAGSAGSGASTRHPAAPYQRPEGASHTVKASSTTSLFTTRKNWSEHILQELQVRSLPSAWPGIERSCERC